MKIYIEFDTEEVACGISMAREAMSEMPDDKFELISRETYAHTVEKRCDVFSIIGHPLNDDGLKHEISIDYEFFCKLMSEPAVAAAANALSEAINEYLASNQEEIGEIKTTVDGEDPVDRLNHELDAILGTDMSDEEAIQELLEKYPELSDVICEDCDIHTIVTAE